MKRPLVSLASSVVLGILAAEFMSVSPFGALVLAGGFCGAAILLLLRKAPPKWGFLVALLAVAAASAAWATCRTAAFRSPGLCALLSRNPKILRVRGFVATLPETRVYPARYGGEEDRVITSFVLRVKECLAGREWRSLRGYLRVSVNGRAGGLNYGRGVDVTMTARAVNPPGNPGESNYGRLLFRKGIAGTGWVAAPDAVRFLPARSGWPGLATIARLKRRLLDVVDRGVPTAQAAIVKCLVLGERSALGEEQERAFRKTGTMHFLAVSGLHVGLLAAFCWYLMLLCGARHRVAAWGVLGVVLLYAVLSGFRPSVQRAAVMAAVICGGYIVGRKPYLPGSMALALTLILLKEPAELFSPGLQLSFAAVFGIVAFAGPLERAVFRLPDALDRLQAAEERSWLRHPLRFIVQKLLAVSLVAWFVTLPLNMKYFAAISPCAPVANVLLVPAVWLVLVAGLPGTLLAAVAGVYAKPLLLLSALGAGMTEWITHVMAGIPRVAVFVPPPGGWWVVLCYGVMLAVVFRKKLRLTKRRVVMLLLVPALAYLGLVWREPPPRHLRVTAVSVGSGNCMLVQFPGGKTLLFDAGSMGWSRVGERIIAPALWAQGVRRLDVVVLSHDDSDHYNGFLDVARRIPVGRLAVPPCFDRHTWSAPFRAQIEKLGMEMVRIGTGDRIAGFDDAEVAVLWPVRGIPFADRFSDNELCVVMRIRSPDGTVLLTGDIERRGAEMLLASEKDLHADFFQVPHHGLHNPVGERLAAAARPAVAVIPGGRRTEVPSPYAAYAKRLLATDDWGMIEVGLTGTGMPRVTPWLDGSGFRNGEKGFW